MTVHIAMEQLQVLADGALNRAEAAALHRHLKQCALCTSAFQRLCGFDRAMRRIPLVAAPPGFTEEVLGRLHIIPGRYRVLGILGFVAPAFSVLVVGGLSLLLVGLTGLSAQGGVHELSNQGIWSGLLQALAAGVNTAAAWMMRTLSQSLAQGTRSIIVTLAGVMPALLLLDWFIRRRNVPR